MANSDPEEMMSEESDVEVESDSDWSMSSVDSDVVAQKMELSHLWAKLDDSSSDSDSWTTISLTDSVAGLLEDSDVEEMEEEKVYSDGEEGPIPEGGEEDEAGTGETDSYTAKNLKKERKMLQEKLEDLEAQVRFTKQELLEVDEELLELKSK